MGGPATAVRPVTPAGAVIGVPTEIKDSENRVSLTPDAVHALVLRGHRVLVQSGAGKGSGFTDDDYLDAGASIASSAAATWEGSTMVVKVKEPLKEEYQYLRRDLVLFTYLHLAAVPELSKALLEAGTTAIAYECVEEVDGAGRVSLPLLTPMSEVAGRMAVQVGSRCLEKLGGGCGMLLGGVPGVPPARVLIIGGGVVGTQAAKMAVGLGASVTIADASLDRLRQLADVFQASGSAVSTLKASERAIAKAAEEADLVIGAVLVKAARAPRILTSEMVKNMKNGSVIVDVAVDQGGCVETMKPTSHSHPTFEYEGVVHCGIPNLPGAVPRTSTVALGNATLPYVLLLAEAVGDGHEGIVNLLRSDVRLASAVNTHGHNCTHPAVARDLGLKHTPLEMCF